MITFRFDDICINTDMELVQKMTDFMFKNFSRCRVIYAVSPLVNKIVSTDIIVRQRVFPSIINAMSDYREFYKVDLAGIPELDSRVVKAGHGLIHIDHRLLSKEAQELSIIASCSLVNTIVFVPPFNKWNKATKEICDEHGIELIKFEDGWLSMEHNDYDHNMNLWYLHSREWTYENFVAWFQGSN